MSYKHFSNIKCEYYPCHKIEDQNCLFCYCPLYFFKDCGGDPSYIGQIKDCSKCVRNHDEESYDFIMKRLKPAFKRIGKDLEMLTLCPDENKL
ncbi:cysteine-rich small domain protein [Denitrovibrio acetiphilus DSM 12809]|uniref:Cysteine-rich small domain protein n=1 Tax=Denitrovibrio acetiphilus (strain DSM 12809 / NBRC 114555 / N2460) TaxID=522772 RepID=D4H8F6_DENA2|nr:cysteine-rich small domain-containing protein [Denitrovibrio acetiphilus]ADD68305.1 cysteine-rich small domain protein [Denitrovibrio acetiphilus DSM 12809]